MENKKDKHCICKFNYHTGDFKMCRIYKYAKHRIFKDHYSVYTRIQGRHAGITFSKYIFEIYFKPIKINGE